VQNLHRTVKDYIQSSQVQEVLQAAMTSKFDSHLRLLSGQLAYIKSTDLEQLDAQERNDQFLRCFHYARSVSPRHATDMILLLDEVDNIGLQLFKPRIPDEKGSWACYLYPENSTGLSGKNFGYKFLSLAVIKSVVEYVRIKSPYLGLTYRFGRSRGATQIPWSLLMDTLGVRRIRGERTHS
jgi:hypothetical protein